MVVGRGEPLHWEFSQAFGERAPGEPINRVDIISALEFDKSGDFLAAGDHGGRVIIFERTDRKDIKSRSCKDLEQSDSSAITHPNYSYKTEFSSHEPEFDYLKSLEIEEKINQLRWLTTLQNKSFILTSNPKTIKLWKVVDRKVKKIKELNPNPIVCAENAILAENSFANDPNGKVVSSNYMIEWRNKKPKYASTEPYAQILMPDTCNGTTQCRKVYAHAHEYNINSVSVNSDGETFLSADDLRINLWNVEISNQCFNTVDMKPSKMEDLMEVITSAEFHPTCCNLLAYSSSRGYIRLADLRQSALCDQSARILRDCESRTSQSLFDEIIRSVSDIKFLSDGMCLLSRDYMNLKLWDIRMEKFPVTTFKVHEYLRPKLSELYNSDSVFDKFKCCSSSDGCHFATGSYSNIFRVFSCNAKGEDNGVILEASKNVSRWKTIQESMRSKIIQTIRINPTYINLYRYRMPEFQATPKAARLLPSFKLGKNRTGNNNSSSNGIVNAFDTTMKVIHLTWHPTSNLIACTAANSLYVYHS